MVELYKNLHKNKQTRLLIPIVEISIKKYEWIGAMKRVKGELWNEMS